MKRTREERSQLAEESLYRAVNGQTMSNFPAIFEGFMAMGIPESEISPRTNVFTFNAWKALGRHVKKGQHGVKVVTFIEAKDKSSEATDTEAESKSYRFPRSTTVFHISQTEPDEVKQ